jgi:hypothetical protein
MTRTTRVALSGILFGILVGALISVLPIPENIVAAAIVVTGWIAIRIRRGVQFTGQAVAVAAVVAAVTIGVATIAPVKQLDGVVPPIRYEHMSLAELCDSLARDHRVFVRPEQALRAQPVLVFRTERPMTRREVLQKLASDTGTHLDILYCGTGASLLFGAHPSFTRLRTAERPPKA